MRKEYLGDGVFVQMDSDGVIVLTTESGGPEPTNIIYLEPEVWAALQRWKAETW